MTISEALAPTSDASASDAAHRATSADLRSRLRARDAEAWRLFAATELQAVFRYCLSRTGDREDAEDLAAQVFEEAWKHASGLRDDDTPARVWLFGIARNLVNTRRRRWLRKPPHLSLEAFELDAGVAAGVVADATGLSADRLDLAAALRQLPASQAEVIALRFIHDLSLEDTAIALRTSVDGVKGRQARALTALRERLVSSDRRR